MHWLKVAKKLEGIHTTETIAKTLGIGRQTTVNYIHMLRTKGFLETGRTGYSRLYTIKPYRIREIGYDGLYETINKNSPVKIVPPYIHRIADHKLSPEETIVKAVLEKDFRLILSVLYLFTKIENWGNLYMFAKENGIERQIGALYELSTKYFKIKEPYKKLLDKMKKAKIKSKFIIEPLKSDDFKNIEKKWGVYIPFNKGDLERYRKEIG